MVQIFIDSVNKVVAVNGIGQSVPAVSLPADVAYALLSRNGDVTVQYVGNAGTTVLTSASFVTPVNQWIDVAGTSLSVARAGKLTLAASMFAAKRQDPALVTVTVGGVSRQWDTSDGAYAQYYGAAKALEGMTNTANAIAANNTSIGTSVNSVVSAASSNNTVVGGSLAAIVAASNTNKTSISAAVVVAGNQYDANGNVTTAGVAPAGLVTLSAPAALTTPSAPASLSTPAVPAYTAFPFGSSTPVAVTAAEMQSLAAACTAVRNALATAYNGHIAAINGLGSVAAVSAYNITAGW